MLIQLITSILTAAAFFTAADDAVTRPRLEAMAQQRSMGEAMIVETFRRHPSDTLPFIDGYLEGGLKLIEDGSPMEDAMRSYAIGFRFAVLADRVDGGDTFTRYAASFASWSPTEREQFRAGQNAYRDGRQAEPTSPQDARVAYRHSADLARNLNDAWGTAMSLAGLARTNKALDRQKDAMRHGTRARELYHDLRLGAAEVEMILLLDDCGQRDLEAMSHAWQIVRSRKPGDDLRVAVVQRYRERLREAGLFDEAARLPEE